MGEEHPKYAIPYHLPLTQAVLGCFMAGPVIYKRPINGGEALLMAMNTKWNLHIQRQVNWLRFPKSVGKPTYCPILGKGGFPGWAGGSCGWC